MNIWAVIESLPRHQRLALAGEIIKRSGASPREVSLAAGMSENWLTKRARDESGRNTRKTA